MRRLGAVFLCAVVAGCSAAVTHQAVKDDTAATGIRYYMNAPYLLVYSDGKGGLKWQILYLPDQSRIMTATPEILGGRTEMTLFFQNGTLSGSSVVGDTTAVPKAIVAAVQSALPLLLPAVFEGPKKNGFPSPYLYKLVVHGSNLEFIGGQGMVDPKTGNIKPDPKTGKSHPTIQVPIPNAGTNP